MDTGSATRRRIVRTRSTHAPTPLAHDQTNLACRAAARAPLSLRSMIQADRTARSSTRTGSAHDSPARKSPGSSGSCASACARLSVLMSLALSMRGRLDTPSRFRERVQGGFEEGRRVGAVTGLAALYPLRDDVNDTPLTTPLCAQMAER